MFARHASAEILFEEAERRGLSPEWVSRCGLFVIGRGDEARYVYYAKLHGNSQLGAQICKDKSLTRAFLEREGFPSIPYCYTNQKSEINRFFDAYHPLIQKPVLAMKAEGVKLVKAREDIDVSSLEDTIFEQYIEGTEYRFLVLDGAVIAAQRKTLDPTESHPWKKRVTNLPASERSADMAVVAKSVAQKLHMKFMAVDFIVDAKGNPWILELTSMPSLYAFHHPHEGEPVNVAGMLLDAIIV